MKNVWGLSAKIDTVGSCFGLPIKQALCYGSMQSRLKQWWFGGLSLCAMIHGMGRPRVDHSFQSKRLVRIRVINHRPAWMLNLDGMLENGKKTCRFACGTKADKKGLKNQL